MELNTQPTNSLPQVRLTERAAEVFKESCLAESHSLQESYLRIGAHPGGCSGYKYDLEWNSPQDVKPTDVRLSSQGIQIVVDKTCLTEVLGPVEIDYTNKTLVEQGFVFTQLIQGHQCGCGESFVPVKDL